MAAHYPNGGSLSYYSDSLRTRSQLPSQPCQIDHAEQRWIQIATGLRSTTSRRIGPHDRARHHLFSAASLRCATCARPADSCFAWRRDVRCINRMQRKAPVRRRTSVRRASRGRRCARDRPALAALAHHARRGELKICTKSSRCFTRMRG